MLASVLKRAGGLGVGTAIGQGIVLAGTPILARIYSPASFGALALLLTVANISIAIGSARFDMALPSADDEDVTGLAQLCVLIAAGLGVTVACLSSLIAFFFPVSGALGEVLTQPVLLGICSFSAAAFQSVSSLLLRHGNIRGMAALRGVQGLLFVALALIAPVGLLWAQALSYAPAVLFLPGIFSTWGSKPGFTAIAKKYRTFPMLSLPGSVLDVVGYSLCIWIVTAAYGASSSGEWSQVQRIVGAPLMLMSISLGQIMLRSSAELKDDSVRLQRLIFHLLILLGTGAAVALLVLAFVGQPMLKLLLGDKWNISSTFIVALSAAVFVRASVSPLSAILATYRRFDLALRWQVTYFISAAFLFTLVSLTLSFHGFVIFFAIHEVILYLLYLRIIMSVFRNS